MQPPCACAMSTMARRHGHDSKSPERVDMPGTAFVKLAPTRPAERFFNRFMGLAHNEAQAYLRLHTELSEVMPWTVRRRFRRPRPCRGDSRGSAHAMPCSRRWRAGASAEQALAVAIALATVHQKFWKSPRFDDDLAYPQSGPLRNTRLGPALLRTCSAPSPKTSTTSCRRTSAMRPRCSSSGGGRSRH